MENVEKLVTYILNLYGIYYTLENSVLTVNFKGTQKDTTAPKVNQSAIIIEYLNEKASKNFKATSEANKKFINARLKDYSEEELKKVIDQKVKDWLGTDFEKYLRPSTLFNATKFEGYLNEANTPTTKENLIEFFSWDD